MAFEFVAWYPYENSKDPKFIGTCHLFDCDSKIDIRGIKIFYDSNKSSVKFKVPGAIGMDEGKPVFYPFISYLDVQKNKELYNACHKYVSPLVKKHLKRPVAPK